MKKSNPLFVLLSYLFLLAPAVSEEVTLLLIPFEVQGNYQPVTSDEVIESFKTALSKATKPEISVKVYDQKTYYLGPEEAARLGKEAGANYVLYGDIRYRKDEKVAHLTGMNQEGYPGGSGGRTGFDSRYMVMIAAVGHGKLVDVASGELVAERPELLMESEYTGAVKGGSEMEKLEDKLAHRCLVEFTQHLLEKLKEEAKTPVKE